MKKTNKKTLLNRVKSAILKTRKHTPILLDVKIVGPTTFIPYPYGKGTNRQLAITGDKTHKANVSMVMSFTKAQLIHKVIIHGKNKYKILNFLNVEKVKRKNKFTYLVTQF